MLFTLEVNQNLQFLINLCVLFVLTNHNTIVLVVNAYNANYNVMSSHTIKVVLR